MPRNRRLIRRILCYARKHADGQNGIGIPTLAGYTHEQVEEHVRLCAEADSKTGRKNSWTPSRKSSA